jgi:ribonuclease HI
MLSVWCDGSVTGGPWGKKGNTDPVHSWAGWFVKDQEGRVLHHHSLDLGTGPGRSGNFSEYLAVRSALFWLRSNGYTKEELLIHSDSQLVQRQLSGQYNVHDPRLLQLRDHVRELAKAFPQVTYQWVRREENREADLLSKALQTWKRLPTWEELQEELQPKPRRARKTIGPAGA